MWETDIARQKVKQHSIIYPFNPLSFDLTYAHESGVLITQHYKLTVLKSFCTEAQIYHSLNDNSGRES